MEAASGQNRVDGEGICGFHGQLLQADPTIAMARKGAAKGRRSIRINLNMGGAYHIELSASIGFGSLRLERDFRVRDESKCLRAIHDYPSVFA